MILCHIKGQVKSLLQIIKFDTWLTIILNSFDGQKLGFSNPIHEFSWPTILISNFLNFQAEKIAFDFLNYTLELFSIFNPFKLSIVLQVSMTTIIPPYFGVFSNIDKFWIFILYSFGIIDERLYNMFKNFEYSLYWAF